MEKQLVLSALGADQPGLVDQISKHILDLKLNIEDSRMSVLGGEFAIMLLVAGDEIQLQTLVNTISELEQKFTGLVFISKYTQSRNQLPDQTYKVKVHALDHPGIVHHLTSFFSVHNINVEDLNTRSYAAPHTGSKMFAVDLTLNISNDTDVAQLRDAFIEHCDRLNLDASFETQSETQAVSD